MSGQRKHDAFARSVAICAAGSFYEGPSAAISVHENSVGANGTLGARSRSSSCWRSILADQLSAHGSLSIAGVVNPAELHRRGGELRRSHERRRQHSALYGHVWPEQRGDPDRDRRRPQYGSSPTQNMYNAGVGLSGESGCDCAARRYYDQRAERRGNRSQRIQSGLFQLVAQGDIDVTGGLPATALGSTFPVFSAGPALLDAAFNPTGPMTDSMARRVRQYWLEAGHPRFKDLCADR